ncbi:MAG: NAD(P)H-dependent oxidoreductase [Caulobacterales bacterium]
MSKPKIGIVIGTTREGRFGEKAARWMLEVGEQRSGDADFEIVDLRDYPMPFFEERLSPAHAPPKNEAAQRWAKKVAELDGYVFVTGEYNHSIPGVLKNALDYAYSEFNRKAAGFVGYGGVGGARAIEHLRSIAVELQIAPMRNGVYIAGADAMGLIREGRDFSEFPHLAATANAVLDELVWWTKALKAAREGF